MESSSVKIDSHQDIFQVFFPPNNARPAGDITTTIYVATHQDSPIDTYTETAVENKPYFSFNEQEKNKTSDWSQVELGEKTQSSICRFSAEETDYVCHNLVEEILFL